MNKFDLLEYYGNFLQNIFTISIDLNIDIQMIIIETIDRIFELMKENFFIDKYENIVKKIINIILNYDNLTHIQKHTIQHIRDFIDFLLIYIKQQSTNHSIAQIFIEQIGISHSYFLLVFERIINEMINYFNTSNINPTYGEILVNILEKLIQSNDNTTLEQILNNPTVHQQFHVLLYTCLAFNKNNENSIAISIWNIYGRIL